MRYLIFKKHLDEKGFTLIEVLTVVALMSLMLLIILPNINNSDEMLSKNLLISQFDSVFQKATKDARTLGEPVEIELQEKSYQIYSSKPNRAVNYPHGAEIDLSDIGKRILIDRKGIVQSPIVLNFEYSKSSYEISINQGYKKAYINNISIDEWKRGGGD